MKFPSSIQNLISQLTQLPSVGPKTAERYVFYLLKQPQEKLNNLAKSLAELKNNLTVCQDCLAISETNPCAICSNQKREQNLLCLVTDTKDMLIIEDTKQYTGKYFILGGTINAIDNIGPDQLNIKKLLEKINKEKITEVILALNPDLEGETTCLYLTKLLKPLNLKITRLAKGMATGSNIEYADELTILNAFKFRNEL